MCLRIRHFRPRPATRRQTAGAVCGTRGPEFRSLGAVSRVGLRCRYGERRRRNRTTARCRGAAPDSYLARNVREARLLITAVLAIALMPIGLAGALVFAGPGGRRYALAVRNGGGVRGRRRVIRRQPGQEAGRKRSSESKPLAAKPLGDSGTPRLPCLGGRASARDAIRSRAHVWRAASRLVGERAPGSARLRPTPGRKTGAHLRIPVSRGS